METKLIEKRIPLLTEQEESLLAHNLKITKHKDLCEIYRITLPCLKSRIINLNKKFGCMSRPQLIEKCRRGSIIFIRDKTREKVEIKITMKRRIILDE